MPVDPALQRRILGHFATGVTIVTTRAATESAGLTVNAFCSLSLDPPLILVAIDRRSFSYEFLKKAGCFAVNILAADQEDISRRFAIPGPKDFTDLAMITAVTGAPIFAEALAWLDCRVTNVVAGGDHDIFIAQIEAGETRQGEPLLYYRGQYRALSATDH